MKWIGQHIWDFISRFRSDVYLEGTETGTIASGGNLGLDSNNKIVKATTVGSATLASTVTVTDSNDSTYFPVVFHNESNGLLDDTGSFEYTPGLGILALTHSSFASISLHHTGDNVNDSHIELYNQRGGSAGQTGDYCGTIDFYGNNNAGTPEKRSFAQIVSSIANHVDSDEAGKLEIKVITEDTLQQALTATGDGASSKVDISLGYGASSTTAVAGTLTCDAGATSIGNGSLAMLSSASNVPSITLFNNNADDTPSHLYFNKLQNGDDGDSLGQIEFQGDDDNGGNMTFAQITGIIADASNGDEGGKLTLEVATNSTEMRQALTATGLGTGSRVDIGLGYGTSSVTTIAGDLDIDGDNMTSAGAMTFTPVGKYTIAAPDLTGDVFHLDANANSNNIVNIDAGTLDIDVTGNTSVNTVEFVVENSTTGVLTVQNTAANATGGTLNIKNTHNGSDADVSDYCGYIKFWGQDSGTPTLMEYGRISTQITDVTSSEEAATMTLQVINNTGTGAMLNGIAIYGNTNVDGNVNVGIASGTSSMTTIAGDLDIDGDNMTSAGAMTFTPVGLYTIVAPDISGPAFVIDADEDTDNEVEINAGLLDVNTTASITMDAADDITISATDNLVLRGEDDVTLSATSADGLLTLASAHTAGQAIHIDGDAHGSSIVDIDAGQLDIDAAQSVSIRSGGSCEFISDTSRYYKLFDFHSTTFENNFSSGNTSGKVLKYSPAADTTLTSGQIYYLRGTGQWYQAHADDDGGGGPGYGDAQLLGVGLGGSSQTVGVLIEGFIRVPSTEILNQPTGGTSGNIDGLPLYVSTTAGHFDFNAPTDSGDYVRIVGYAIDDYSNDILVYFNPDKTYIEIA